MGKLSNETRDQLLYIGYFGRRDVQSVFHWLMDSKGYYVFVRPLPHHRWASAIIRLGKPNTQDGLLNGVEVGTDYISYDAALVAGIEEIVGILCDAEKNAKNMSNEELEAMRNELEGKGFDFD